jgi:hypothetical protein
MELESAWAVPLEDPDKEVGTYVDALGVEHTETLLPMPDRSMRAKGPAAASMSRLAAHTGTTQWATKGNEVEALPFDNDVVRATQGYAQIARMRTEDLVRDNRQNTQDAPKHESAEVGRDGLYNGLNPTFQARPNLPATRRGVQSHTVVGAEHMSRFSRAPVRGAAPHVRKAGAVEAEEVGARKAVDDRRAVSSAVPLFSNGAYGTLPPASRAADVTPQAAALPVHNTSRRAPAVMPQAHAIAGSDAERAPRERPHVYVADSRNDVRRTDDARGGTRSDEATGPRPDAVLGTTDSTTTVAPRPLSFDQTAALAADAVLGTQDSQHTRDAPMVQMDFSAAAATAAVDVGQWAMGPVRGRAPVHTDAERARALDAAAHPTLRSDAAVVQRVVHDRTDSERAALEAAHARPLRADRSSVPVALPTYTERAALAAARVLGSNDAVDVGNEARPQSMAATWAARMRSLTSRSTRDAGIAARTGNTVQIVQAAPQPGHLPRALRDDGTVQQRAAPLATGPLQVSTTSRLPPNSRDYGRETPTRMMAPTYACVRGPAAAVQQRGTRVG